MSGAGRLTLWTSAGLLLAAGVGVRVLLQVVGRRLEPACMDAVAAAPDGDFVRSVRSQGEGLRVTYDDGLALDVPRAPRRIVSALPGITEMLCYLGARQRIVARSRWCDHPPEVRAIPAVSVQPLDAEAVLAARADLLIADRRLHRRDLGAMRSRAGSILLLETSRSLEHLAVSMRTLAQVLGTAQAQERQADFQRRLAVLTERLAAPTPGSPPRVLVVAQWDPLYVLGHGSLLDDLLRVCGCVNIACDLQTDASGTFNEELVLARRPDVLLRPREPLPGRLRERWRHVPAVQHGRILDGSADDLVRGGPRILGALERLAAELREVR